MPQNQAIRVFGQALYKFPNVLDIRGIGMLWGIEFAKDKKTLEPFSRSDRIIERIWQTLFENGVITYRVTSLAGINGDALLVAPPFTIEEEEIHMVADKVMHAVDETLK